MGSSSGWSIEIESGGVGETLEIGRALGERLEGGDLVGLTGPLGAGKTQLIKGIAAGLEVVDDRQICSPTFILVKEYEGRQHVFHLDGYRLEGARALEDLGFEEMCTAGGVVLVEWADRVAEAFDSRALWIDLAVTGETQRLFSLHTASAEFGRRLAGAGLDRWR